MRPETHHATIEAILETWRARLGRQYEAYRGHVYRVYNYCLQLRPCADDEKAKLAIASCFHDIGIWSDATLDYLPPSVAHANTHLAPGTINHPHTGTSAILWSRYSARQT